MDGRYARQIRLPELSRAGQDKLAAARILVVGCGGLGSMACELLVRAGVGKVRIVDRDIVEIGNLHRQVLFDEQDAADSLPKAEAARRKLCRINSEIAVQAQVVDLAPHNIERLLDGVDLVIDGTDNVETRYLVNDACLDAGVPWIYGGAIGVSGMLMVIRPGEGPCLRCVFPEPPPPGSLPTCETAGVLGSLPALVASWQVTEAIKLLVDRQAVVRDLVVIDAWHGEHKRVQVDRDERCRACALGQRDFLDGLELTKLTRLCGSNAVQIDPPQEFGRSLQEIEASLKEAGEVSFNGHLVHFVAEDLEMLIFPDGRTIVRGTSDPVRAKTFFAKYIGA